MTVGFRTNSRIGDPTALWQNRYNTLGATSAALLLVSSKDFFVKLASLRLLNNLLFNGNEDVQATIFHNLRDLQSPDFM